jgi:hypothetical protein
MCPGYAEPGDRGGSFQQVLVQDAVRPRETASRTDRADTIARWAPVVALIAIVVTWAIVLRSELHPGATPNDASFHRAYLEWATQRLRNGSNPLGGTFPNLGLDFPVFEHYQVLPYLLTAPVALVLGAAGTFVAAQYALLVLWPVGLYAALRLVDLERWTAVAAAGLSLLVVSRPGYGIELGSFVWRGYGMWTQLWGIWFLAFGLACAWRALTRGRSLALAAVLLAACVTSQLQTGFLALVVVMAWGLVGPGPRRRTLGRAAAITAGAGLLSVWLLVPAWIDQGATALDNPANSTWRDSFGVGQVLSWLGRGELFDHRRLPVLTVFAAIGLIGVVRAAVVDRDGRARGLLVMAATSLVLFFGSSVVGPVIDHLPGRDALYLHRMIVGVHLAGIVMAAIGLRWCVTRLAATIGRVLDPSVRTAVVASTAVVLGAVVIGIAFEPVLRYVTQQDEWVAAQRRADSTDGRDLAALAHIAQAGGGRTYAGTRDGAFAGEGVGYVPAHIGLLELGVPAVGFSGRVGALTEQTEARFSGDSAGADHALDVRWHIRPTGVAGPAGATRVATRGPFTLWRLETGGPVELVDTTPPIRVDRNDTAVASELFLASDMPADGRYPLLALDGARAGPTTAPAGHASRPGTVSGVSTDPGGQWFAADVHASRPGVVVVKVSDHPRWTARVDGRGVPTFPVAPGLLAFAVPAGNHHVQATFDGFPALAGGGLALAGLVGLALLLLIDRRARRQT